ncbi:MAG: hypothetical protein DHS20C21_13940 [Gemmatimonadota bacterium]|nr:MAG: hypothetical protein DHS20C21_13940 [Gemmatimonadota bacterium]
MFFGKRRRKKDQGGKKFDETYVGEDFGFDEESGSRKPSRPEAPEPPDDDEFPPMRTPRRDPAPRRPDPRQDISQGRSLDDATFVGGAPDGSPPLRPPTSDPAVPSLLGASDDEEDLSDATRFIGAPVDARVTVVAWLVAASGSGRGRDYRLQPGTTTVGGAAESAIRLVGDEYASTHHAEIRQEGGGYVLHDLRSTNGTFHNDARAQQVVLQDGDRIRFGLSEFIYKCVQL